MGETCNKFTASARSFLPLNASGEIGYFTAMQTIADRIRLLLEHQGRSAREVSLAAGKSTSLVQNILKQKGKSPRGDTISRLAAALGADEAWLLSGDPERAPKFVPAAPTPSASRRPAIQEDERKASGRDLPVLGTAAGAAIQEGAFAIGEPIAWVDRPRALLGDKGAYALYVVGDSMAPAYCQGAPVVVTASRPPRIGDIVIIQTKNNEHAPVEAWIKRFDGYKNNFLLAHQYNPDATIEFPRERVVAIHRVLTTADLIGA